MGHPIVVVDFGFILSVAPGRFRSDIVSRGAFKPTLVEVDDVPAQVRIIFQHGPRQGMVLISVPRNPPNDMIAYATFPDTLSIIKSWIEPRLSPAAL
jgi:hypothetical protein